MLGAGILMLLVYIRLHNLAISLMTGLAMEKRWKGGPESSAVSGT
jgi:hypothetical protein